MDPVVRQTWWFHQFSVQLRLHLVSFLVWNITLFINYWKTKKNLYIQAQLNNDTWAYRASSMPSWHVVKYSKCCLCSDSCVSRSKFINICCILRSAIWAYQFLTKLSDRWSERITVPNIKANDQFWMPVINHGVTDRVHTQCNVAQKMLFAVRACMVYLLKLWIISVSAHGLNFWGGLYDILGDYYVI